MLRSSNARWFRRQKLEGQKFKVRRGEHSSFNKMLAIKSEDVSIQHSYKCVCLLAQSWERLRTSWPASLVESVNPWLTERLCLIKVRWGATDKDRELHICPTHTHMNIQRFAHTHTPCMYHIYIQKINNTYAFSEIRATLNQSHLQSKFKASLGYISPYLKSKIKWKEQKLSCGSHQQILVILALGSLRQKHSMFEGSLCCHCLMSS